MKNLKKGSIVTEVLVTIVVVAIAMLAVVPMFLMGVKSGKISKNKTVTSNIAQQEIEKINEKGFTGVLDDLNQKFANNPTQYAFVPTFTDDNVDKSLNDNKPDVPEIEVIFVNRENGEVRKIWEKKDSRFRPTNITRHYSFIEEASGIFDDIIQVTIKVEMNGEGKPAIMTTMLHRDQVN